MVIRISLILLLFFIPLFSVHADNISDNLDLATEANNNNSETVDDLVKDAQMLFIDNRPIDARAKLQKAVTIAPNDYRPHMFLGAYYLEEVAHFPLAYRYLKTSERLFEEKYHVSTLTAQPNEEVWREHAKLLYLISEARLNLDDYQGSLETLDRFAERYWDDWFPGTKAWVLMKLNRVDEAIRVAQAGLLRNSSPGRTYNILGILLSMKDNRSLALEAFGRAIKAELAMGGSGQAATPLNNAGEVYHELFADDLAEAAWIRALTFPDGCEHILPSLNLAILYVDKLQFFQAERVLDDFEACFAQRALRTDTEHRALLALGRGRIALHKGEIEKALDLLTSAADRQQWFGKIGTSADDLRFAATVALADALRSTAATLNDTQYKTISEKLKSSILKPWFEMRAWWLERQARQIATTELNDFEDLYVRHTDAMLEYPTLGLIMPGFPTRALKVRIQRMLSEDKRKPAHSYYQLYLGTNLLDHGDSEKALELFGSAKPGFREIDGLARAELLAKSIKAQNNLLSFWHKPSKEQLIASIKQRSELFNLLPSSLRYNDLSLPVQVQFNLEDQKTKSLASKLLDKLRVRFEEIPPELSQNVAFLLRISQKGAQIKLDLEDLLNKQNIANISTNVTLEENNTVDLINNFIAKVFSHKVDPPSEPLPRLDLMQGLP